MAGRSDRIFGMLGLLLAMLYVWRATRIELSFISDPFGPKVFPFVIATILAASSIAIILKPDEEPAWPSLPRLFEIVMAVAVLVAYAQLLPELGFVLTTAIAAAYLSWRLGTPPLKAAIAGIIIAVGIYAVFHLALGLSLARGPWGF